MKQVAMKNIKKKDKALAFYANSQSIIKKLKESEAPKIVIQILFLKYWMFDSPR